MSAAAWVASSREVAWIPCGTGTPWRAKSCLPWYSSRSMRRANPSEAGLPEPVFHNARRDAAAKEDRVGDVRRLRDVDRLGDRDLRGLRQGGRARRLHDRSR